MDLDKTKAYIKHAILCMKILTEAGSKYGEGGDEAYNAKSNLDREISHIKNAQRRIAERKQTSHEIARLCTLFADQARLLTTHLNFNERLKWGQDGIEAARILNDRRAETSHLGNLGTVHLDMGNIARALECYTQAGTIAEEFEMLDLEFSQWLGISNCHFVLGRYELALYGYRRALNLSRWIDDKSGEALCRANIANTLQIMGEVDEAIKWHEDALHIAQELKDVGQEVLHLMNLGNAHLTQDNLPEAERNLSLALRMSIKLRDYSKQTCLHQSLGILYLKAGEYPQSRVHLANALRIAQKNNFIVEKGDVYRVIGSLYERLDHPWLAISCYEIAVSIAEDHAFTNNQVVYLVKLGNVFGRMSLYHEAVRAFRNAEMLLGKSPGDKSQLDLFMGLANAYLELDLNLTAERYFHKSLGIIERFELLEERAECLLFMGKNFLNQRKYRQAIWCHQHGEYLARRLGMYELQCAHNGYWGNVFLKKGEFRKAKRAFNRARRLARYS
ncbi:tetratricopeptide repeat protein, partial [Planctomycetota bacterium]